MAQFTVNTTAYRSVQELQVPREVGSARIRGRREQGQRAEAHDRSRQPSRRRRPQHAAPFARAVQIRADHARARHHASTRSSRSGRIWSTAPRATARSRSRTSARTSSSSLLNLQGVVVRSYQVFRCWVSEYTAQPELDANANAILRVHGAAERGLGARSRRDRAGRDLIGRRPTMLCVLLDPGIDEPPAGIPAPAHRRRRGRSGRRRGRAARAPAGARRPSDPRRRGGPPADGRSRPAACGAPAGHLRRSDRGGCALSRLRSPVRRRFLAGRAGRCAESAPPGGRRRARRRRSLSTG